MTSGLTTSKLEFLLNGKTFSLQGVGVQTTLLDVVRAHGLTGAKEGCAEGECGACMVLLVTGQEAGCAYRAVNSCLILAPMVAGQEIYTVEGLAAKGKLSAAQHAMAIGGGSQCGYCTPGFVVSLFAEHYRPGRVGPCRTEALGGNLCRCTGYRPIQDATQSLGSPPEGAFLARLVRPSPRLEAVRYLAAGATFDRPATLQECVSLANNHPQARWIAGATDLAVESNLRFQRWPHLVSLEAIPELLEFSDTPQSVRIGAALSLTEIERRWSHPPDILEQWWPLFASQAIRNRATLGGNLATASPIGDAAPMLLALDASVHLIGQNGKRTLPLVAFFKDYRQSVLEPGELIVTVEIPKPYPAFTRFYKVAKRRMDDISTVAAGFAAAFDGNGRVMRARFAFGGVAAIPLRLYGAEDAALGKRWNETLEKQIQAVLEKALNPMSDHRGSAEYRREVAKALIQKFGWEQRMAAA